MSGSSNISQSTYSPSEPETPQQGSTKSRIQALDQSMSNGEPGHNSDTFLKEKEKSEHLNRIRELRKQLEYIKATEWAFDYDKGVMQ